MKKYQVALSFAGEDRHYVEKVAEHLRKNGVNVFYDKFEETTLWGKNLYQHLDEVYQNEAEYVVIFVSEAYVRKSWTRHELRSAQAGAFGEEREYVLPAVFDGNVQVPGLPRTVGYINLDGRTPEDFAEKIVEKLRPSGVAMSDSSFSYIEEAFSDIDFPRSEKNEFSKILSDLKISNWHVQNAAIDKFLSFDINDYTKDQLFVFGRNICQCAQGSVNRAEAFLRNLRGELSSLPLDAAEHIVNGIAYEVYFNSNGIFRGFDLKADFIAEVLKVYKAKKFERCLAFILDALKPYADRLAVLPSNPPKDVLIEIQLQAGQSKAIKSVKFKGVELMTDFGVKAGVPFNCLVRLGRTFTVGALKEEFSKKWKVPIDQLKIDCGLPEKQCFDLEFPPDLAIKPSFLVEQKSPWM